MGLNIDFARISSVWYFAHKRLTIDKTLKKRNIGEIYSIMLNHNFMQCANYVSGNVHFLDNSRKLTAVVHTFSPVGDVHTLQLTLCSIVIILRTSKGLKHSIWVKSSNHKYIMTLIEVHTYIISHKTLLLCFWVEVVTGP